MGFYYEFMDAVYNNDLHLIKKMEKSYYDTVQFYLEIYNIFIFNEKITIAKFICKKNPRKSLMQDFKQYTRNLKNVKFIFNNYISVHCFDKIFICKIKNSFFNKNYKKKEYLAKLL
jgi:hypothetical protein